MRSARIMRILCLLGFLLLIAPFYRSCGVRRMADETSVNVNVDTTIVTETDINTTIQNPVKVDTIVDNTMVSDNDSIQTDEIKVIPFYQKVYDIVVDEDSESAFELAYSFINGFNEMFISNKNEQNREFYIISMMINRFFFVLIVLISLLMTIFAFSNKLKWVYKLSITSLIFITITLFCFIFLEIGFESYKQIKWGYYAFISVQIGILVYSRRLLRQEKQLISNKIE